MHKKRGQSYYAEILDPEAKKFLHHCNLCGRVGLLPSALGSDYDAVKELKTVKWDVKGEKLRQKGVVEILQRTYEPLSLDKF